MSMNSVGELKMKFNKPIQNLPLIISDKENQRRLVQASLEIGDIFSVNVKDADEFDDEDKSIWSVSLKE